MKDKLAVQMFTIREHTRTAKDLAESLKLISDMGYTAVQLSAVGCMNGDTPEVTVRDAKRLLDDHGLKCIATHRSWDALLKFTEGEIAFHKTLECDYAAIGGIPGDQYEYSHDGFRKWIAAALPMVKKLKAEGIRFGHHNHSREFFRPERGGQSLEDILIDEGGSDLMLELDLYWVDHAGVNPERILERCKGRVPVIHIKDKEVMRDSNETAMAPIGEGNLDWAHLIPACEAAGVKWYGVEQDVCRRDPFDCLKSSFEFLSTLSV